MTKILRKQRTYPYPPEQVWVALTDPRALAEWLMPNTFKAEVGHVFQFRTDPQPMCGDGTTECTVLELDPPKRMVWEWRQHKPKKQGPGLCEPMTIIWELTPVQNGTRLDFEQHGLEHIPWIWRLMMTFGWGTMIKRWIPKVAANAKPDGSFAPGAIPLKKRCYKVKTIPDEFVR